jgi:hypothetical protein
MLLKMVNSSFSSADYCAKKKYAVLSTISITELSILPSDAAFETGTGLT